MSTVIATIFGLCAGVGWGLGPVASKYAYEDGCTPVAATVVQTTIAVVVLSTLVLATQASSLTTVEFVGIAPFIVSGVVSSVVGRYLLYRGISYVGASVNSSVAATDPLFATVLGVFAISEIPSIIQIVGCVITVLGVVVVVSSDGGNKSEWRTRLIILPLFAAFLYGTGAVIRRFGLETSHVTPMLAASVNEISAIVVWGVVFFIKRESPFKGLSFSDYRYLLLTGLLFSFGTVSMFVSLHAGPVVIGTTLGSTAGVISVIASKLWLSHSESVTPLVVIGAIITVCGVILLSI